MREYRVKKGLRLLVYVLASLGILIYGGLAIILIAPPINTFITERQESMPEKFLPLLFLIMVPIMVIAIIATKKSKIITTDESIISISLFKKRELKFNEIKGFNRRRIRINLIVIDYITIIPISGKKIEISNFIENRSALETFLNSKITNLDKVAFKVLQEKVQKEYNEILTSNQLGFSKEEREDKLKKAHLTAKILNGAGVVVTLWTFFFPKPYEYAIIACISLPLIGLLALKFWKGLIRIDVEKGSIYPSIPFCIAFPGVLLSLRAMLDFSIEDYSNIWILAITIAVVFTSLLIFKNKELSLKTGKSYFTILGFLIFTFAYGYGAIVTTNCAFDKSIPQVFSTKIVDKQISGGRYKTYDLYLSPWGTKTEIEKVSIDIDMYRHLNNGDEVSIYQLKGRFDIPWLEVDYAR